jgi:hypothetical protein
VIQGLCRWLRSPSRGPIFEVSVAIRSVVLPESGEWQHIAVVPASPSGSVQRLAEEETSDATNNKSVSSTQRAEYKEELTLALL